MKVEGKPPPFDPKTFLARVGAGKTRAELRKRQIVFAQGDPADAVFYIQKGKIELRILSQQGKEAIQLWRAGARSAGQRHGQAAWTVTPPRPIPATSHLPAGIVRRSFF